MSSYTPGSVSRLQLADSLSADAFGRMRVGLPQLRLSCIFDSSKRLDVWNEVETATGTATHLPNERSVRMRVAAAGDQVLRQTREYFAYRAAESHLVLTTFVLAPPQANLVQEVGYYDAQNGIFLRANGTTIELVRRTYTSGVAVDSAVAQSAWNLDPMNGLGPSGRTINWSKAQIFVIDLQWLGVGRVRAAFTIDGISFPAHEFDHANVLSIVYMTSPKLPVRYRIEATGAIGGNRDMLQVCSSVLREGGADTPVTSHEARSITAAAGDITVATAWETVIGVRLNSLNLRATIRPTGCALLNTGGVAMEYAVALNPPGLGAAVWGAFSNTDTVAEMSRSNIAITVGAAGDPTSGHTYPLGGYCAAATGSGARGSGDATSHANDTSPCVATIAGVPDEVWLLARAYSGTSTCKGILRWEEER